MKKIAFTLMSLVLVSIASSAFAADEMYLSVDCRDARQELRDAGYLVKVTTGGVAGIPLASVARQSIAGPMSLGSYAVKINDRGMERIYSGPNLTLTIQLESLVRTAVHPAQLRFNGLVAPLICKIYR